MRTSLCWIGLAAAVALAGAGCKHEKPSPSDPAATGSAMAGSATAGSAMAGSAVAPKPAGGVEIFVDDTSIGVVGADKIASWPRVDSLVPDTARKLGTWELVTIDPVGPGDAKPTEIAHPSGAFPDMVPAIFPAADGAGVSFGMFDTVELAKKGAPAMHADHVRAIHIKLAQGGNRGQNDDQGGGAADPTKLTLSVKTAHGTTTLTGEQLIALPREPAPNNLDQKGWRLQQLLAAAGVTTFKQLVLTDATGTTLALDKKDLGAGTVPFIKLNKSGQLRFRVLTKQGDGWSSSGDLRALATIDVK
ncbi:MAG TPA: hypothetical protein VFP84_24260 [Kofleriaceae bacterium]|nr:hypothetical protein [Kofleriaceae bacterium]